MGASDELAEILDVINESNRASYRDIIPAERFREPVLTPGELLEMAERMTFFTHREGGRLVGVAALAEGQAHWVYVLPGHQRRGVGTALMGRVEAEARARGVRRLRVDTARGAHWARAFYEGLGYRLVEERDTPEGGVATYEKELGTR